MTNPVLSFVKTLPEYDFFFFCNFLLFVMTLYCVITNGNYVFNIEISILDVDEPLVKMGFSKSIENVWLSEFHI